MSYQNVWEMIPAEENAYQTTPIRISDGFEWHMADHILTTILYKNSQYKSGKDNNKPFKNIIRPILNLAYRAEGFDVKDIQLFVNSPKDYYKSFLANKYHDKWARLNAIDTFIDELVESYVDFGGVLVKNVNGIRPEVVPLQRIAFCDQTDILKGPICEKHFYSPDELQDYKKYGWKNIEEVITLSREEKTNAPTSPKQTVKTPGKYIEVYEVHGIFPAYWLSEDRGDELIRQIHIITFYTNKDGVKVGIPLYQGKEKESPYKLLLRDKIYGRALGLGGAEELFEPQIWTNYDMIRMKGMLDIASKVIFQTSDTAFANRNKTAGLVNGEILITEQNMPITQINTSPINLSIFERSVSEWEQHAKTMGSATDALLGETKSSNRQAYDTAALVTSQGQAIHEYRMGKIATFLDEIYRDWIMPYFAKEISGGQEFLSELTIEELQKVSESLVICEANKLIKEKILNGEVIDPEQVELFKQQVKESFTKGGTKKFIKILKDEMKDLPLDVFINIKGKQKDLMNVVDKLNNVVRQIVSSTNPQTGQSVLDDPRMAKIFNSMWEAAGLSPIDLSTSYQPKPQAPQEVANQPVTK